MLTYIAMKASSEDKELVDAVCFETATAIVRCKISRWSQRGRCPWSVHD
jgi:hypothetical protein